MVAVPFVEIATLKRISSPFDIVYPLDKSDGFFSTIENPTSTTVQRANSCILIFAWPRIVSDSPIPF